MSIRKEGEIAVFEFVDHWIADFREGIGAWGDGVGDFGIGPRWDGRRSKKRDLGARDLASGEVWFWTPLMDP